MSATTGQVGGFNVFMQVTPAGGADAPAAAPAAAGTAEIQYGSERLAVVPNGRSIRQLFNDNAEALSFERNRSVVFRSGGVVVEGDGVALAGRTYVATVTFEQKG